MRPGRIPARPSEPEPVAGNGLLDRRLFLRGGAAMASALPVAAVAAALVFATGLGLGSGSSLISVRRHLES